ncbi:SGNH hydrolase [Eremomyces bilateralis CBS 781.70]|uniref:SGNH hydrolase n=1 Tax=Eremomyces bilateralis CBS 781.70 TaxID=1392243 RepID=A0A6G1FQG4_9PEZI|nr:SGNH hydrolase [Eremomyces bilateralis CBS 781.70]KAF1807892.1 SGNH hydrolase [Eremomyces bilateralis CBS 781.70]
MAKSLVWLLFLSSLVCHVFAVVRIMPLGDSVTAGVSGCWRQVLWQNLAQSGLEGQFKFVGTQKSLFSCPGEYDLEHEGHVGYEAIGIASKGQLSGWLNQVKPVDIGMILLGTNDVWRGRSVVDGEAAFTKLVEQFRTQKPTVRILIAQIMNLQPRGVNCGSTCPQAVSAWNEMIAAVASKLNTPQSPVIAVDCFTGFDIATDTQDGIHPNSGSGTQKVAACWQEPLEKEIRAVIAAEGGKSSFISEYM